MILLYPKTVAAFVLSHALALCHAGQQTVQMVKHVAQEQGRLSGYAFGVGCGVARSGSTPLHASALCLYSC